MTIDCKECTECELIRLIRADNKIDYIVICDCIAYDVTRLLGIVQLISKNIGKDLGAAPDPEDFDAVYAYLSQPVALESMSILSHFNGGPSQINDLKEGLNVFVDLPIRIMLPPDGEEGDVFIKAVFVIDCNAMKAMVYWPAILDGLC
jgi:hypothetical protein